MDINKVENSFVILGAKHNPTVLLGSFFKDSGMISSNSEINSDNVIVTPGLSQVHFKNGDTLILNPERLLIRGNFGKSPFIKGIKYCETLKHISYKAIGINFKYRIFDVVLSDFIPNVDKNSFKTAGIKFQFDHDYGICNLTLNSKQSGEKHFIEADFNYDYKVKSSRKIGDLHFKVLEEREKNIAKSEEVIYELFE